MDDVVLERGGETRWRRFLVVLAAGVAGAAVLLLAMAQGALAVSFAVAGTPLKIAADRLKGFGVVQFGTVDREVSGKPHVVEVNAFRKAFINGFCESVFTPHVPLVGNATLRVTAPVVTADNLVIDLADLTGDLSFDNAQLNIDASQVTAGPPGVRGLPGTSGAQASAVTAYDLRETAWAVTAGTLSFHGFALSVRPGGTECF